jgi:hypothetical protein
LITFSRMEIFVAENIGPHVTGVAWAGGFHGEWRTLEGGEGLWGKDWGENGMG